MVSPIEARKHPAPISRSIISPPIFGRMMELLKGIDFEDMRLKSCSLVMREVSVKKDPMRVLKRRVLEEVSTTSSTRLLFRAWRKSLNLMLLSLAPVDFYLSRNAAKAIASAIRSPVR